MTAFRPGFGANLMPRFVVDVDMDPLHSLIYVSSAVLEFSQTELEDLLAKARHKNAGLGITGLLLYCDGNFMQCLEGPRSHVIGLFEEICRDPRHHQVFTIATEAAAERNFPDWNMAFRVVDLPDWLHVTAGASVSGSAPPAVLDVGSSFKQVLAEFWRNSQRR